MSDAPVPPSAIVISTTSVILPPDMSTLSDACVASEPSPRDSLASESASSAQLVPFDTKKWSWFCSRPAKVVRLALRSCLASSWS